MGDVGGGVWPFSTCPLEGEYESYCFWLTKWRPAFHFFFLLLQKMIENYAEMVIHKLILRGHRNFQCI
jgi:hypothetical protein